MRKVLLLIDYQKGFKSDCSKATIPKNLTVHTYRILVIQRTVHTTEGMLW